MIKMVLLFVAFMIIGTTSLAGVPNYNFKDFYSYGKEETMLALKVEKLKDKYQLKYVNFEDLAETAKIVTKHCSYEQDFNKYDLMALFIKESKLDKNAINKSDGGKGLGQITNPKEWWKEELPWFNNPFDKEQAVKASIIALKTMKSQYRSKPDAFKHYNGSTWKSKKYSKDVMKIASEIRAI